jgi:hypothetical protein
MDTIKAGAGHVNTGAGYLAQGVTVAMQLYYAKELKDFESKITQATGELETLQATKAAAELKSKLTLLEQAKEEFKNAVTAYDAAIEDRRTAMAAIASETDKALVGAKGQQKGQDFVGQTLLYMASVRENRSLIGSAMSAGETAKSSIASARTQLGSHRSAEYQTNREAHGTTTRIEELGAKVGPDTEMLSKMSGLTVGWLDKAAVEKKLLDAQEVSAAKVMSAAGRSGAY